MPRWPIHRSVGLPCPAIVYAHYVVPTTLRRSLAEAKLIRQTRPRRMARSLEAYADDNAPRQVRHLKEQADRVNLPATRYGQDQRLKPEMPPYPNPTLAGRKPAVIGRQPISNEAYLS
jgi:hypothetical protein